jgi:hypothetical protein
MFSCEFDRRQVAGFLNADTENCAGSMHGAGFDDGIDFQIKLGD